MIGFFERAAYPIENTQQTPILPESVRYSLHYNNGQLNSAEILDLLPHTAFRDIGHYLSIKLLDQHPMQQILIRSVVNALVKEEDTARPIRETLKYIDPQISTIGRKTVLISRRGPEIFHEQFQHFANESRTNNATPVLIGYAGFLGLSAFAQQKGGGHTFGMLLTDQSIKRNKPVGYALRLLPNRTYEVNSLESIRDSNNQLCIIDDVVRTHKTASTVTSLLEKNGYPEVAYERFATNLSCYASE